eukprot:gnl/MRDRNA2_/MRDRNA2_83546_c0_seq5.p1 gnl/MRDRNA2_/MRDRNA2_83546_c0~~gnl/MRDRNA2_/MRDRNA2_83546_c0_seq5.p1  ORF type:complete len:488 (-),score=49.64 gnl/MRDRNA2_/MRDRNA2_83546_c0_seq5:158-1621(-)
MAQLQKRGIAIFTAVVILQVMTVVILSSLYSTQVMNYFRGVPSQLPATLPATPPDTQEGIHREPDKPEKKTTSPATLPATPPDAQDGIRHQPHKPVKPEKKTTLRSTHNAIADLLTFQECASQSHHKCPEGEISQDKTSDPLSGLETSGLRDHLEGLHILLVGDSVMGQLYQGMKCTLLSNTTVEFFQMPVVPHKSELLEKVIENLFDGPFSWKADVIVFNFGLWYNLNPIDTHMLVKNGVPKMLGHIPASWSAKLVGEQCFIAGNKDGRAWSRYKLGCYGFSPRPGEPASETSQALTDYSYHRKWIGPDALDMKAYASDLRRFKNTLSRLRMKRKKMPELIWKYTTPQHFPTQNGLYDWLGPKAVLKNLLGRPKQEKKEGEHYCKDLENPKEAYARNMIAEDILAPLFDSGVMKLMSKSYAKTAEYYNFHMENHLPNDVKWDCTHYCLNSMVPRFWIQDLLEVIGTQHSAKVVGTQHSEKVLFKAA